MIKLKILIQVEINNKLSSQVNLWNPRSQLPSHNNKAINNLWWARAMVIQANSSWVWIKDISSLFLKMLEFQFNNRHNKWDSKMVSWLQIQSMAIRFQIKLTMLNQLKKCFSNNSSICNIKQTLLMFHLTKQWSLHKIMENNSMLKPLECLCTVWLRETSKNGSNFNKKFLAQMTHPSMKQSSKRQRKNTMKWQWKISQSTTSNCINFWIKRKLRRL